MLASAQVRIAQFVESSQHGVEVHSDLRRALFTFGRRDRGKDQYQCCRRKDLQGFHIQATVSKAFFEDQQDAGHFTGGT